MKKLAELCAELVVALVAVGLLSLLVYAISQQPARGDEPSPLLTFDSGPRVLRWDVQATPEPTFMHPLIHTPMDLAAFLGGILLCLVFAVLLIGIFCGAVAFILGAIGGLLGNHRRRRAEKKAAAEAGTKK